jgi:ABC-type transport system substrate-binding protein
MYKSAYISYKQIDAMMRRIVTIALCFLLLLPSSCFFEGGEGGGSNKAILKAAVQAEMRTTNILNSDHLSTSYVLDLCYETVMKIEPNREELVPHVLVGTETNGVAGLQNEEIGIFGFLPGSTDEVVAYYDFTNARFHDGEQVDIMDVIFSYHILALHPRWFRTVSPLMDNGGVNSNYSNDRWLWAWVVDDGDGNPLTASARFHTTTAYYRSWQDTMNILLLPRHVWEGTGRIRNSDGTYKENIHDDFGRAIDPDNKGLGVNEIRNPGWKKFDLVSGARAWEPNQDEVIGNGMFKFEEYIQGSHAKVIRFEGYLEKETAKASIHKAYIEGIEFITFPTPQQATLALKKGDVDIILWSVPPDFIPDLQSDPNIVLLPFPDLGFSYLGHNMDSAVLGYPNDDPLQGDTGKPLRRAIAHLIDKKIFVDYDLQGYGIPADGLVNPLNTFWYNSSLPEYAYSLDIAKSVLDSNGYVDNDGDGWRDLDPTSPGDQDDELKIYSPSYDFDFARAESCNQLANKMKEAGINAKCVQVSFFTLVEKMQEGKYELAISGWSVIETEPTSMLYYIFHSEGAGNYAGYKSVLFDQVITRAMNEVDISKRQHLIKWAQGILAEDLPINVLYFRKNIISYRVDRLNLQLHNGKGILDYWTLMNICLPGTCLGDIDILGPSIKLASAVASNSTEIVRVTVYLNKSKYGNSKPFNGANVILETTDGYLSPSNGTTNANGDFVTTFHAPFVPSYYEHGLKVFVTVRVEMERYQSYTITALIVVFPEGVKFLSATIDFPFGDIVTEGDTALMDILIKDEFKFPVDNATVHFTSTPSDALIEPQNGATFDGRIEGVELTVQEVDDDTLFRIALNASKSGHVGANASASIYVLDVKQLVCSECGAQAPLFWLLILVTIFIAVAAIMVSLKIPDDRP